MTSSINDSLKQKDDSRHESPYMGLDREIITRGHANETLLPQPQPSKPKETILPTQSTRNENGLHEHNIEVVKGQEKLVSLESMLRNAKLGYKAESLLNRMLTWTGIPRKDSKTKGETGSFRSLAKNYGKRGHVIGHGAFGTVRIVYKLNAEDPASSQLFAVKEFKQRSQDSFEKHKKRILSEFSISSSMFHPHIVVTFELFQNAQGAFCQVMEYCSGGDLYTLILLAGQLNMTEADCFFKQLMRGIEYLHEMGVAHRDLKPENILLTQRGMIKIADFGNAECFRMAWETEVHTLSGVCGSGPYIAPEEYVDKEFDGRAVDIWASGMIYMSMRAGYHIWTTSQRGKDKSFECYVQNRKKETGYKPIELLERVSSCTLLCDCTDTKSGWMPERRLLDA